MTDTLQEKSPLWQIREEYGIGRERVASLLEPPISSKTVERWEKGLSKVPGWRVKQFARIYEMPVDEFKARLNGTAP